MRTSDETASLRARAAFWMAVTTLLWGGSFVFNKIAFRELHPLAFLTLRFLAATCLMGLVARQRLLRLDRRTTARGITVGLALFLANVSFVFGVDGTSVSRAGFLNNLFVLLIPLVSFVVWRERVSRSTFAGIAVAVCGLWTLAGGSSEGFSRGDLLSTVCAFFIALHIIAVSRVLRDDDLYAVTFVQFATVTIAGGTVALAAGVPFSGLGPVSAASLAYCAVFPTVVCFTLQNRWQRYVSASEAGLIYTLDPLWSMLGGVLLLGERLSGRELAGCFLILCGVLLPLLVRKGSEVLQGRAPQPAAEG